MLSSPEERRSLAEAIKADVAAALLPFTARQGRVFVQVARDGVVTIRETRYNPDSETEGEVASAPDAPSS
jgi:hypothetical protein